MGLIRADTGDSVEPSRRSVGNPPSGAQGRQTHEALANRHGLPIDLFRDFGRRSRGLLLERAGERKRRCRADAPHTGDRLRTSVEAILVLQRPPFPDRAGSGAGLPDQEGKRTRIKADQAIGRFALDESQCLDPSLDRPRGVSRIVPARRSFGGDRTEDRKRSDANIRGSGGSKVTSHVEIVCVKTAEFTLLGCTPSVRHGNKELVVSLENTGRKQRTAAYLQTSRVRFEGSPICDEHGGSLQPIKKTGAGSGRAQLLSFNFPNNLICAGKSTTRGFQ
jgi:hypothetical protein